LIAGYGELVQEGNKIEEQLSIKASWRETNRVVQSRTGPVGPLARDTEGASLQLAEDQSVDTGDASFLEYFEPLPPKGVERMTDLGESQMRVVGKCSSH
jgi:hypothetical protein